MRTRFVMPAALICVASLFGVAPRTRVGASPPLDPHSAGHRLEVQRILAHFDSVLTELASRDITSLSVSQQRERHALLLTLSAYRDRAAFPHNYDFAAPTPYFVDRRTGVLCAVAHLLESTGRRDIVDRVAETDNNTWVPALAGDAAFTRWLNVHGLTLDEAARIQVPYVQDGNPIVLAMGSRDNAYVAGTAVTAGAAMATALWNAWGNADGHRRLGTVLGFTTSALALGFAAATLSDRSAPGYAAPVSLASGAMTVFVSTRGLVRHRNAATARREADLTRRMARVSVSPVLPVSGRGTGVALQVAF